MRHREIDIEEYNARQNNNKFAITIDKESFPNVLVMPPAKNPFVEIKDLNLILLNEWRQSKDTKKLEIAGDTNSDRVMSYEEYLKIYDVAKEIQTETYKLL